MKILKVKHQVTPKKKAVKLEAETFSQGIRLIVREGRAEFGKSAFLSVAEALLVADWLRETALELLRKSDNIEVE